MPHKLAQFGSLKLIGRLSLGLAAAALLALLLFLALLESAAGPLGAASPAHGKLPLLLLAGGLLLAVGTALLAWATAVNGSFRVAGPLHRLCLVLREGIDQGRMPQIRLRRGDELQAHAGQLEDCAGALYQHYDELAAALEMAALRIRRGRPTGETGSCPGERVHALVGQIRL